MVSAICNLIKRVFALNLSSAKDCALAVVGTLLIVLIPELFSGPQEVSTEAIPEGLRQIHEVMSGPHDLSFFITLGFVCLLGPVVEELIFRGALWRLIEKFIDKHYALFITSILFAAAHSDPEHIIAVFPIGLWVGWLRLRSESIYPSILAHVINNSIVSLFIIMQ